nr:MAG TPA: hypothetical protein [Caudoviricetes sp.]
MICGFCELLVMQEVICYDIRTKFIKKKGCNKC